MRIVAAAVLMSLATAGAAHAQALTSSSESKGYAEAVVQSAFGNVTSQSFGGEVGVTVRSGLQVFVDAGQIRDAAPSSLGNRAQQIAAGIAANAGPTDYRVKQPVTFGVVGIKAILPTSTSLEPYIALGGGAAQVKRDVTFTSTGGDVSQFATLGQDLSGTETKGMLSVGGGLGWPVSRHVIVDLQYRYGWIFTSGEGLNVNRAGVGVGVRF
jgi:opacity protein-like surface antigen